ncbi:MAG: Phage shock protein PspC (stress-responsive transcriptional regulator) [Chloroflexi bacterium AL-W]|nr:Phage shock protein PspC (stress-responsive transcriptional regulator) [Chloroflexi bacterium AL-N1]NOK65878.1 Phage shock protein PspC (stress-responsive transcriptional regulator) [Chloroflexi bacterium AL-N10]NOK74181.1 Phage shock protein PspC (stress-responsive transcriptional regulator) [Chloroflexi bacterium AL-N5]NOK80911.1 Phage shock protein PspC (stress-responsive transcriptional regulator) [Chloroflexi bacterium AL-W]NOK88439.1 Phage shock protein PspC (stress-responsive transcri
MSKRLLRDTQNEKIADVCSGITHRLQLDPVLIRLMFLGWMFLGLLGFIGVVAGGLSIISYIMLWIVMPDDRRHSIIE